MTSSDGGIAVAYLYLKEKNRRFWVPITTLYLKCVLVRQIVPTFYSLIFLKNKMFVSCRYYNHNTKYVNNIVYACSELIVKN